MHYADIIAALHKAGYPPAKVCRELEVKSSSVSQVIHSRATSYNIASFISLVTNIPLNTIWPDERYSTPPYARKQLTKTAKVVGL